MWCVACVERVTELHARGFGGRVNLGVGDMPATGRKISLSSQDEWALTAASEGAGVRVRSVSGTLHIQLEDQRFIVKGHLVLEAEAVCDRCGEPAVLQVSDDVDLQYLPIVRNEPNDEDAEVELSADELDAGWYEGTSLDMKRTLCEAVALAWPSRALCAEQEPCEARARDLLDADKSAMSPFAALRGLVDA